jgi:hypothetical protein
VSDTDTTELHSLALRIALTIGRDPRTQALALVDRVHAFHGHHDQSDHGNWADKLKKTKHAPSYETDAKNREVVDRKRNLSESVDEHARRVSQSHAGNADDAEAKRRDDAVNAKAEAKQRAEERVKAAKKRAEKAAKAKAKREREKRERDKKRKAAEQAKKKS